MCQECIEMDIDMKGVVFCVDEELESLMTKVENEYCFKKHLLSQCRSCFEIGNIDNVKLMSGDVSKFMKSHGLIYNKDVTKLVAIKVYGIEPCVAESNRTILNLYFVRSVLGSLKKFDPNLQLPGNLCEVVEILSGCCIIVLFLSSAGFMALCFMLYAGKPTRTVKI